MSAAEAIAASAIFLLELAVEAASKSASPVGNSSALPQDGCAPGVLAWVDEVGNQEPANALPRKPHSMSGYPIQFKFLTAGLKHMCKHFSE